MRQTTNTKFDESCEGVYKYQQISVISHGFGHDSQVYLPTISWFCPSVLHPFYFGGGLLFGLFLARSGNFVLPFHWSFAFVDQK